MNKPIELAIYTFGFLSGNFFEHPILKTVFTVIAMVMGTIVSFYVKQFLIRRSKKKRS
ncbi:hypothetical protein [uncultured Aquimarina sp.]|uniref:hypothetical protein n=1 Tax=uncultured Aquimarina sp. TaxID=575652 RepID=UPI002623E731|nr:hypothetical protein [uncultured Aquimarina sp.]